MATIYQRGKKKRWHALVRRKGMGSVDRAFATKSDAMVWARDIESKLDRGIVRDITKSREVTMAELFDRYEEATRHTKRNAPHERHMLRMLTRRLGSLTLAGLTREKVSRFRDERRAEGRSAATVRNNLHLLSAVIQMAVNDWGYDLPFNPVRRVSKPRADNARERRLEPGEEERLLEAAAQHRNPLMRPLIILAIETAMRLGELLGLEWDRVDLDKREAYLPKTKNGKSRRVPLSSRAIAALRSIKRGDSPHVFHSWRGVTSFQHAWQRLRTRIGSDDLRFHDLRHEAASRFAEGGMDIIRIAAITGHSSLQMLKRYTHFRTRDLADELDRISRHLPLHS